MASGDRMAWCRSLSNETIVLCVDNTIWQLELPRRLRSRALWSCLIRR